MIETRICLYCKARFSADRTKETRNGGKKKKFCKKSCEYKYKKKNNYRGEDWDKIRKKILERDGNKCTQCKKTKDLQVHHITPYHKTANNGEDNLITLCPTHHSDEDNRIIRFGKPSRKIRDYMKSLHNQPQHTPTKLRKPTSEQPIPL